mmetsp:Transcript_34797/g.40010  ORF Transcript_34797/g.40010 Transcript_34797/m.40010 type:complete len:85 (+) Transcript_34797:82-336(+)
MSNHIDCILDWTRRTVSGVEWISGVSCCRVLPHTPCPLVDPSTTQQCSTVEQRCRLYNRVREWTTLVLEEEVLDAAPDRECQQK